MEKCTRPVIFTNTCDNCENHAGNISITELVAGRDSPESDLSVTPSLRPPSPPSELNVTVVSTTSVGVYWSAPVYDGGWVGLQRKLSSQYQIKCAK